MHIPETTRIAFPSLPPLGHYPEYANTIIFLARLTTTGYPESQTKGEPLLRYTVERSTRQVA